MGKSNGQVMILTILVLGGTILGASTIAGLLMLYQLHQSKNLISSTQAIYAADAGIECGLYDVIHNGDSDGSNLASDCNSQFSNGASNDLTFDNNAIISVGSAVGNVQRAFYISVQSTSTLLKIPQ